jgi:hypothetical protein
MRERDDIPVTVRAFLLGWMLSPDTLIGINTILQVKENVQSDAGLKHTTDFAGCRKVQSGVD